MLRIMTIPLPVGATRMQAVAAYSTALTLRGDIAAVQMPLTDHVVDGAVRVLLPEDARPVTDPGDLAAVAAGLAVRDAAVHRKLLWRAIPGRALTATLTGVEITLPAFGRNDRVRATRSAVFRGTPPLLPGDDPAALLDAHRPMTVGLITGIDSLAVSPDGVVHAGVWDPAQAPMGYDLVVAAESARAWWGDNADPDAMRRAYNTRLAEAFADSPCWCGRDADAHTLTATDAALYRLVHRITDPVIPGSPRAPLPDPRDAALIRAAIDERVAARSRAGEPRPAPTTALPGPRF